MHENDLKRLQELEKHLALSDEEYTFLEACSTSTDEDIRITVAQLLCLHQTKEAKRILVYMLNDESNIVRMNVCDSMGSFVDEAILDELLGIIKGEQDSYVRAYALLSAKDIASQLHAEAKCRAKRIFEMIIATEQIPEIVIAAYSGLYTLGDVGKLEYLFSELDNDNYQVRCFATNILLDVVNDSNREKIITVLEEKRKTEQSIAVLSTFDFVLKQLA